VETIKALKEAAVVTGAAVVQSEANRYAAEVLIPDLKKNIRETENALSTLLSRRPALLNALRWKNKYLIKIYSQVYLLFY
jgi:outer membrane protein TolC